MSFPECLYYAIGTCILLNFKQMSDGSRGVHLFSYLDDNLVPSSSFKAHISEIPTAWVKI